MVKSKSSHPSHASQLVALRRIEGQVRGIQKMISEHRYCVDILIQLNSVVGAIQRVQDNVLEGHLKGCFSKAVSDKSSAAREKKIKEVIDLIKQFRKA